MGAVESSAVESVHTLSSALDRIEKKLTQIEDIHLHHEARICHDDMVIVADKKIRCRPGVSLIVGPVLGLITQSSANILVEVNVATTVTFNVYLIDSISQEGQYMHSESFDLSPYAPKVVCIGNLTPGSQHAIYLGGVAPTDTLSNYCMFSTIPSNPANLQVLFTHESRVDCCVGGDADMWSELEQSVSFQQKYSYRDVTDHNSAMHAHDMISSIVSHAMPTFDTLSHTHTGKNSVSQSSNRKNGAHMVFHLGNVVSVDKCLRSAAIQLIRDVSSDDVPAELWKQRLDDIERSVRAVYRKALTGSASVRSALRRTGHVFLCGQSEGGGDGLHDLFDTLPCPPSADDQKSTRRTDSMKVAEQSTISDSSPKDGGEDVTMEENLSDDEEELWENIGEVVMSSSEWVKKSAAQLSRDQKDVANLVHGMLLRIARRVHMCYMRQLWDQNYASFVDFDNAEHDAHCWILRVLKSVQGKRSVRQRMENSYKLLAERGTDGPRHKAVEQLRKDLQRLQTEVTDLESTLIRLYEENTARADQFAESALQPISLLNLGGESSVVVVDPHWCELVSPTGLPASAPVGDALVPTNVEIEIGKKFWKQLSDMLSDDRVTAEQSRIGAKLDSYEQEVDGQNVVNETVDEGEQGTHVPGCTISNVIVVSTKILVPASVDILDICGSDHLTDQYVASCIGSRLPSTGLVTPDDRRMLLSTLASWKEKREGRGCIVACALDVPTYCGESKAFRVFSEGWTVSHGEGMLSAQDNDDNRGAISSDYSNAEPRLRYILVGGMTPRREGCLGRGSMTGLDSAFCDVGSKTYNEAVLLAALEESTTEASIERRKLLSTEWAAYGHLAVTNSASPSGVPGFTRVSIAPTDVGYASMLTAGSDHAPPELRMQSSILQQSSTGVEFGSPELYYSVECVCAGVPDIASVPTMTLGPVVGAMTPYSAQVLCEYSLPAGSTVVQVELSIVDQITSAEYVCRRRVKSRRPVVFTFNGLLPNKSYVILNHHPGPNSNVYTDSLPHPYKLRIGSFTTPCSIPIQTFAVQMHKWAIQTLKQRLVELGPPSMQSLPVAGGNASDDSNATANSVIASFAESTVSAAISASCKSIAAKHLNQIRLSTQNDGDKNKGVASKSGTKPSQSGAARSTVVGIAGLGGVVLGVPQNDQQRQLQHQIDITERQQSANKLAAIRILVVGSNQPSWRHHIAESIEQGYADKNTPPSSDLAHMTQGDAICQTLAGIAQSGWSGIDLIIHCGSNVDINLTLDDTFTTLARAERMTSPTRREELLGLAEEQLRNAYRLHWGTPASSFCTLLGQGSHLCSVSNAAVDLLEATHYSSISDLVNDYSEFCVENMLRMMTDLQREYQQSLWNPSVGHNIPRNENNYVHFLNAGSVCVFPIAPVITWGERYGDALTLTESQFSKLEDILRGGKSSVFSATHVSGARDRLHVSANQSILTSIVLVSPVQLVYPAVDEPSLRDMLAPAGRQQYGLKFVDGIVQRLLDILADWALEGTDEENSPPSKEVIIVCPGQAYGQTMRVQCFNLNDMVPHRGSSNVDPLDVSSPQPTSAFTRFQPAVVFKQLCCGPSVGIPMRYHPSSNGGMNAEDDVNNSEENGELAAVVDAVGLSSSRYPLYSPTGRAFVCAIDKSTADPHCGMLVVGGDIRERRRTMREVGTRLRNRERELEVATARSGHSSGSRRGSFDQLMMQKEKEERLHLKFCGDVSLLTRNTLQELKVHLSQMEGRHVPPTVQKVWGIVRSRLESSQGNTKEKVSVETEVVEKAVHEVCRRLDKLFSKSHKLYQQNLFGGGVLAGHESGGEAGDLGGNCPHGIITMLLNLMDWMLGEMPRNFREIFPAPAPILLKWYWHHFTLNNCQEIYAVVKVDRNTSVSLNEVALLALRDNYSLFVTFCSGCLKSSALCVQIAEQYGLTAE